jgi:hypothetical protein
MRFATVFATARTGLESRAILTRNLKQGASSMTTILDSAQQALGADHGSLPTIEYQIECFFSEAERTRSAQNILLWQSYLPHDCVQLMINMGWDYST